MKLNKGVQKVCQFFEPHCLWTVHHRSGMASADGRTNHERTSRPVGYHSPGQNPCSQAGTPYSGGAYTAPMPISISGNPKAHISVRKIEL